MEAEGMAVKFGMEMAHRFHLHSIAIQNDCQQVERLITGQVVSQVEVGQITKEIKEMGQAFQHIEWIHIPRKQNRVAHEMAHIACNWEEIECWVDRPPIILVALLNEELACLNIDD
ncbi:unnamed protein product [Linum trigynum]|uniref:RNase H type-1 domain-containing protein n=1 Tax=Linum trigynum TaxID=586398 RepID=A0AAV2DB50_9ROSI